MDSREARNRASEIKFVLDAATGGAIRDWARTHLQPDPHGTGPFGDSYETSSLYFDTGAYDVFNRRGSFGRAKYRIRRYANANEVFLERKLRRPRLLVKRRTRAPLEVLPRLALGASLDPWLGSWFSARLAARRLAPVCQISYHRIARGLDGTEGPIRLTLDDDIFARPVTGLQFTGGNGEPVLPGRLILELKFRGAPPAIFRRLVDEFALRTQTASKYRLGMTALGHAGDACDADEFAGRLEEARG